MTTQPANIIEFCTRIGGESERFVLLSDPVDNHEETRIVCSGHTFTILLVDSVDDTHCCDLAKIFSLFSSSLTENPPEVEHAEQYVEAWLILKGKYDHQVHSMVEGFPR